MPVKEPPISSKLWTIDEIKERVTPIASRYGLKRVWLFGSYARGDATAKSDVDFCVDDADGKIHSALDLSGLYLDFQDALSKKVDIVFHDYLANEFRQEINKELLRVYGTEKA